MSFHELIPSLALSILVKNSFPPLGHCMHYAAGGGRLVLVLGAGSANLGLGGNLLVNSRYISGRLLVIAASRRRLMAALIAIPKTEKATNRPAVPPPN
jgi:hypothetical protein